MLKYKSGLVKFNLHTMYNKYNKGLIRTIIVIVIALIILGYFGFNIKNILNGSTVQANLNNTWDFLMKIWNNYLAGPVIYIWDKFVVGVLWKLILAGMAALGL